MIKGLFNYDVSRLGGRGVWQMLKDAGWVGAIVFKRKILKAENTSIARNITKPNCF